LFIASRYIFAGSDEEREAFKKANHQNKLLQQKQNHGLHLTIKVTTDMRKGCDFDVFAVVTNNTQSEKKCRLAFGSCALSYNGFLGGNCGFKDLLNVELSPGAGKVMWSWRENDVECESSHSDKENLFVSC